MRDALHTLPSTDDVTPELGRKTHIDVLRPVLGSQVQPGGFRGDGGEDVPFGEGDGFIGVGVGDLEILGGGVSHESVKVPGFGGRDDGRCQAAGVEGLVDAHEHESMKVQTG